MQAAVALRFLNEGCTIPFFVISGRLKAHCAIQKKEKRQYILLNLVKYPILLQITCFSKPRMRAKFQCSDFVKIELMGLFQMMKDVLQTIICIGMACL